MGLRPRGGQPKDPAEKKRNNLTFRVRDKLKADLEAAAAANSRSVSEEVEFRLLQSFDRESLQKLLSSELRKYAELMYEKASL